MLTVPVWLRLLCKRVWLIFVVRPIYNQITCNFIVCTDFYRIISFTCFKNDHGLSLASEACFEDHISEFQVSGQEVEVNFIPVLKIIHVFLYFNEKLIIRKSYLGRTGNFWIAPRPCNSKDLCIPVLLPLT